MKPPRLSVAGLMIVVVVVALNVAVARALHSIHEAIPVGVALCGLAVQVGLFRLMRSRGRERPFWAGFIACGLLAMASFAWAMFFPVVLGITSTGALVETPGSPLYTIWTGYGEFAFERLGPLLIDPRVNPDPDGRDSVLGGICIVGIRAVILSLPQLLIALSGGLLAQGIARAMRHRPVFARPA